MPIGKYRKVWITLLIFYVLTFILSYLNPMQSDDYWFFQKGLSWSTHWDFYLTWSGRFIIDYISSFILSIDNHLIIALISSLALPLLIYHLVSIPYYQEEQQNEVGLVLSIIILWCAYWLANPALGETTFWVVGSANYLWPLVFVSALIKYVLRFSYQDYLSWKQWLLIAVLAICSGCSNEATGALLLYVLVLLYGWCWYNKGNRSVIVMSFIIAFAGYLVVFFAPGNLVRAGAVQSNALLYILVATQRLTHHFLVIVPTILQSYWPIYPVLLWAVDRSYRYFQKSDKLLFWIFISATLMFCIIELASPHAGLARTNITGLFFLLLGLSFLLKNSFKSLIFSKLAILLFFILVGGYAFSYTAMINAYYSLHKQAEIRVAIINEEKSKGVNEVVVPNFYRGQYVLRYGDYPELVYPNAEPIGAYFGIKRVDRVFADFSYEKILAMPCAISYQAVTKQTSLIKCIYIQRLWLSGITRFIVEFEPAVAEKKAKLSSFSIKIANHFNEKDERYYSINLPLVVIKIGNRYFASADVASDLFQTDQDPDLRLQIKGAVTEKGDDSLVVPVKIEGGYEIM